MRLFALRGAITVDHNDAEAILGATERLVRDLLERNGLEPDAIVRKVKRAQTDSGSEVGRGPEKAGIANLIEDLHDRGMENDVVTVVWGEFGRTPKINMSDAGRDHWAPAMSALVAGGGLKMGQAIGATDSQGGQSRSTPYTPANVLANLYRHLGIDPSATIPDLSKRPMAVLDDREPVRELVTA